MATCTQIYQIADRLDISNAKTIQTFQSDNSSGIEISTKNDFTGHVSVNIKMNQYGVPTSMDVDIYDDEDGSLVYSEECALLGGTILDTITQCVEVIDLATSTPLYELKEAQEQL